VNQECKQKWTRVIKSLAQLDHEKTREKTPRKKGGLDEKEFGKKEPYCGGPRGEGWGEKSFKTAEILTERSLGEGVGERHVPFCLSAFGH